MKRPVLLICAALLSATITVPAAAAIIVVTASGTIARGTDGAALFGDAGRDLSGSLYSVRFDIDTSRGFVTGGLVTFPGHGPVYYNSTLHNRAGAPAITGSIQIGDRTVFVDGSKFGINDYGALLHTGQSSVRQDVASADIELSFYDFYNTVYPVAPGGDPAAGPFHDPNLNPVSFDVDTQDHQFELGSFQAARTLGSTNLDLNSNRLAYTVISATGGPTSFVPEPSSWALMLVGFGAAGLRLRRRLPGSRSPQA